MSPPHSKAFYFFDAQVFALKKKQNIFFKQYL